MSLYNCNCDQFQFRLVFEQGARHGLETLSQLALTDPVDGKTYMVTGIKIEDSPYYLWRGLSVDTSRNFISPPVIK